MTLASVVSCTNAAVFSRNRAIGGTPSTSINVAASFFERGSVGEGPRRGIDVGKREMYAAALDLASERAFAALEGVRGRPAVEVVEASFAMWRGLLTTTDLRLGCAVLAVAVAGEDSDSIAHSGHIFATWRAQLQSLFVESGTAADRAHSLAALTIASAEGGVAIARAEKSIASFELVASEVADLARAID